MCSVMTIWRIGGKLIRTALCCIAYCNPAQSYVHTHTHTRTHMSSGLGLVCVFCSYVRFMRFGCTAAASPLLFKLGNPAICGSQPVVIPHSASSGLRLGFYVFVFILDMIIAFGLCVCFFVVSTSASNCLKRLVSEMTYYVSSGTLNPTHSLTHSCFMRFRICCRSIFCTMVCFTYC